MNDRTSIFDTEMDLSDFTPKPRASASPKPDKKAIRESAEQRGFSSREPKSEVEPVPVAPVRRPRRHVTGRNQQFNVKATAETVQRFYDISDAQGWVLGETLEHALAALEQKLSSK